MSIEDLELREEEQLVACQETASQIASRSQSKCKKFRNYCLVNVSILATLLILAIVVVTVVSSRSCPLPDIYSNATSWPVLNTLGLYLPFRDASNSCWVNWYAQDKPSPINMLWGMMLDHNNSSLPNSQEELERVLPIQTPFWMLNPTIPKEEELKGVRVTWLGHGTVLAELEDSLVLIDPMFSERASPYQWVGPKRFTRPACTVQELPNNIKAVAITHSHYDHLDYHSVNQLHQRFGNQIHWFVPMNMKSYFVENFQSMKPENVNEMRWWDRNVINGTNTTMVFTPCNHWGRRGLFDENRELWGSWAILGNNSRFWVSGDTSYARDMFRQIGQELGPFDLSAIGIGGYRPRHLMKFNHITPEEAVMIHTDIRSKRSLGIHWATFTQTHEPFMEPKTLTEEAKTKHGLAAQEFVVVNIGDSVLGAE